MANLLTDAVITGFTTGAAILIIFHQLPKSLGIEETTGGVLAAGWDSITNPDVWQLGAIIFSIATIIVIFGGPISTSFIPRCPHCGGVWDSAASKAINYSGPVVGELSGGFISLKFRFEWGSIASYYCPQ